jgi:hypothetical protein
MKKHRVMDPQHPHKSPVACLILRRQSRHERRVVCSATLHDRAGT